MVQRAGAYDGSAPRADVAHAVLFAAAAALGGFMFGYDTAVINGAVGAIRDRFEIGAGETGLAVSLTLLGAALGAWTAGRIADRIGRIWVMRIAAVLFAVGSLGSAFPFDIVDLTFWRFVGGTAVGLASVISPAYIAEISPAKIRGRLGSMYQLAIVLGIAVSQLVNYALAAAAGGAGNNLAGIAAWQWMLALAAVPSLLYLVLTTTIPESPRFLVSQGRIDDARRIVADLEGGDEARITSRIGEIQASLGTERVRVRVRDLFSEHYRVASLVFIGIGLAALQQFVGINVIFYYSATLWQAVGFGEDRSLLISVVSALVNILGTFVAIGVIDRVGRKPLLLTGSAGMAITLATVSVCFHSATITRDEHGESVATLSDTNGAIALVAANLFVFFFALSWGPVVWVLISEMFPNRVRAAAVGVATSANWIANFLVSSTFPSLADWNLSITYAVYAGMAVLSFLFVTKFVKETRGRTLEEAG
ncbi:sugar porter family MFS transporter [Rhodococcus triatomae]|uniref:MFS transporter, sugar porter (SP) family n=1 Tax=Rhodococcus triatomae TaxID=300028 RepID=A0A1G8MMU6_9NOCA|nr:sugar porter family MFS transporter [Rhodococcus triatomae]QNG19039.1 sugar porter family MFS transporter [Rhodococcus triatomae]QNG25048.1 sugar porter family MFS transporter [Rhodococcus triatomae]SDI69252.1 MFS transporter, sugar porter (SP) family [Rhodococcus triatomae]